MDPTPPPTEPAAAPPPEPAMERPEVPAAEADMTVLIKSPTDAPGTPAFTLRLPRSALVRDAKSALAEQYPSRPPAGTQRLIHAGRLLGDGDALATALTGESPQVMHLVAAAPPIAQRVPSATAEQNAPPAAAPAAAPAGPPAPGPGYTAHLEDVEAAFARLLHHQTRYTALLRAGPAAPPQALAHELAHLQAATAQFDASTAAQAAAIRHVAGPDGAMHGPGQMFPGMPGFANMPFQGIPGFHAMMYQAGQAVPPPQFANAPRGDEAPAPDAAPGVRPDAGNGEGNVWRRHFVFQFDLNWALLAKLAFFVILLAQDASRQRTNMLLVFAIVIYLWQTGHLGFLRRLMNVVLPSPNQLFEIVSSMASSADGAEGEIPRSFVIRQSAVLTSYLYSFGYGFVCSLLPSWNPEPLPQLFHMFAANEQPEDDMAAEGQDGDAAGEGMPPPDADWRPEDAPREAEHAHAD